MGILIGYLLCILPASIWAAVIIAKTTKMDNIDAAGLGFMVGMIWPVSIFIGLVSLMLRAVVRR
jgi:hypothetical protein